MATQNVKAPTHACCPRASILNREPLPLHGILARNGYRHRTELRGDGAFVIHIEAA